MSNVRGTLECENGDGHVTAHVQGTGTSGGVVYVSLNGQDRTQISKLGDKPGDWSGTLSGTFNDGETVYLVVERSDGSKKIQVTTVHCDAPPTTMTPPTTTPPVVSSNPPVVGPPTTVSITSVPPVRRLPEVGSDSGLLVAGGLGLIAIGAALVAATARFFDRNSA